MVYSTPITQQIVRLHIIGQNTKTVEELEEEVKNKDEIINELQAAVAKLQEQVRELQEK